MNKTILSTALSAYLAQTMMADTGASDAPAINVDPTLDPATAGTAAAETSTATDPAAPATVSGQEMTYFFKTPILKDEEGKEIGKGTKHPDVKILAPVPSIEDLINFLAAADGTKEAKVRDLIVDSIKDTIFLAGRRQINEFFEANPGKNFAATDMDLNKLSIQAIAETPKGQRGAWAPGDDDFKEFNELYTTVLVHKTGYDPKKTKTHTDHWKQGMVKVKTNKPVVAKLKDFLTLFAANVSEEEMEEVKDTYGWLVARADRYLKAEEKNFLEAL